MIGFYNAMQLEEMSTGQIEFLIENYKSIYATLKYNASKIVYLHT